MSTRAISYDPNRPVVNGLRVCLDSSYKSDGGALLAAMAHTVEKEQRVAAFIAIELPASNQLESTGDQVQRICESNSDSDLFSMSSDSGLSATVSADLKKSQGRKEAKPCNQDGHSLLHLDPKPFGFVSEDFFWATRN